MKISKLDAARQQLEVACRLFLQRESILAVHTLCGAAEDILGRLAVRANEKSMFERMKSAAEHHFGRPMSTKEVSELINGTRNALKHANDPSEDPFDYNPDHGFVMLLRALVNFQLVTGGLSQVMEETWESLKATHPLFLPPNQRPHT
jgi:hypothetical protein